MTWDPDQLGNRTRPAWTAALHVLADGHWHLWDDVTTAMAAASDILPKSCSNRIHDAVLAGYLIRKGRTHNRQIRLNPLVETKE